MTHMQKLNDLKRAAIRKDKINEVAVEVDHEFDEQCEVAILDRTIQISTIHMLKKLQILIL